MRTRFLGWVLVVLVAKPNPVLPTLGSAILHGADRAGAGDPVGPQHPLPPRPDPEQATRDIFLTRHGPVGG